MACRYLESAGKSERRSWQSLSSAIDVDMFSVVRTPVLLICRDRLTYLSELVSWLEVAGFDDITFLDNASTYEPLLEWYERSPHNVVRLAENVGPHAPWSTGYLERVHKRHWVLISDPDVLPVPECPHDVDSELRRLFRTHPFTTKIGLSLCIDDIPNHSPPRRATILNTEAHHLAPKARRGRVYRAGVDTTFALYRPGALFEIGGYRAAEPLMARHLPWYEDFSSLPEDVRYYYEHSAGFSTWATFDDPTSERATADLEAINEALRRDRTLSFRMRRAAKVRLAPYRRWT
jgi:hypothetical protein